jgi:hypothetical protein
MDKKPKIWKLTLIIGNMAIGLYCFLFLGGGGFSDADKYPLFHDWLQNYDFSGYLSWLSTIIERLWNLLPDNLPRWWDIPTSLFILFISVAGLKSMHDLSEKRIEKRINGLTVTKEELEEMEEEKEKNRRDNLGFFIIGLSLFILLIVITISNNNGELGYLSILLYSIVFSTVTFFLGISIGLKKIFTQVAILLFGSILPPIIIGALFSGFVFSFMFVAISCLIPGLTFLVAGIIIGGLLKIIRFPKFLRG